MNFSYWRSSLIVIVCVSLVILLLPSSASAESALWIDILDTATMNDSGLNEAVLSSDESSFIMAYNNVLGVYIGSVDILFITNDDSPELTVGNYELNVVEVADTVWRAYGEIRTRTDNVKLKLTYSNGTYIDIMSFRVMKTRNTRVELTSDVSVAYSSGDSSFSYPTKTSFTKSVNGQFIVSMALYGSKKFDYLDVELYVEGASFNSISASFNGDVLPLDVSYLYPNTIGDDWVRVGITIDVRDIVRHDSAATTFLYLNGTADSTLVFTIESITGYVLTHETSTDVYWWTQLRDWITGSFSSLTSSLSGWFETTWGLLEEIRDAIAGDSSAGDQIGSDLDEVGDVEQNYQDKVDQSWNDVSSNFDQITGDVGLSGGLGFYSDIVQGIFEASGDFGFAAVTLLTVTVALMFI